MRELFLKFRPLFLYAGLFSFFINLLLLVPSIYMLQVFDRVLTSRSNETLLLLSIASAGALVVMFMLDQLRARLLMGAGILLDRLLGGSVLAMLIENSAKANANEYVHGLRDAGALRSFLTGNSIVALFDAPWLPFFIAVIFVFHPLLGIVALAGALLLLLLAWANEKLTRKPLEEMQAASRRAGRYIDTSLRNAEVVNAMGMQQSVRMRWEKLNQEVIKLQSGTGRIAGLVGGSSKFLRQFIQIAMLGTGAYLVIDQHVTPGVMMAATIILGRALAPVEGLIANWKVLVEARAAYARLDAMLLNAPKLLDETELPAPAGHILVEKVIFAASNRDKPIIKGVSLALPAGESLGIIGPSASGKSTLARLLIGTWKPISGAIRLDGADVSQWSREHLGRHIGYLPQDVELFPGTISENIARLGPLDSEGVIQAAQRAFAHEMILRLPQGYDTPIGEGGVVLSGGQRQRIALARALYGNPKLVVLDEPNANLDAEGEVALLQSMRLMKEQAVTLVVVTHKPSLLAGIDKILVLREGVAEMFGPREQVLARVAPSSQTQERKAADVA